MQNINYIGWSKNINETANVCWRINRYCNYACSYCWPGAHQNKKDFLNEDVYLNAIDDIIQQFKNNGFEKINWSWAGGEVTFNPHFLKILDEIQLQDISSTTTLVTNLSQNLKWWSQFVHHTKKFNKVRVNGSWHKEYLISDKQKNLFREKLIFLQNNKILASASCVMLPGELNQINELKKFLNDKKIKLSIKPCRQNNKIIDGYKEEEINTFNNQTPLAKSKGTIMTTDTNGNDHWYDTTEKLQTHDLNFLKWTCTAGYGSITIEADGTVFRGSTCRNEKLGNIKDKFTIFSKPSKCITNKNCNCNTDLKMPKWRDDGNNMSKVG